MFLASQLVQYSVGPTPVFGDGGTGSFFKTGKSRHEIGEQDMTPTDGITPAQSRVVLGLAGFLTLTGAALLVFGISFLQSAIASRNWPTAAGTVQKVAVVSERSSNGNTRAYTYHYVVTYGYGVDEQIYTGDRYSLGTGSIAVANCIKT